jgi:hypothetical protein
MFNALSDGSTRYQSDDEAWLYLGKLPQRTEVRSIELHNGPASGGVMVVL